MTLTIAQNATLKSFDKLGRLFGLANRGIMVRSIDVTFGASDDYATGGVTADLLMDGMKEILSATCSFNDAGVSAQYDIANKKIKMYGQKPTISTTPSQALTELANASQATRSKKFSFLVIGR